MEWRTLEVRWFHPGPCPDEVVDWFCSPPGIGQPERRTDEYAALGRDDLGIKRRGGALLDVKVRTAQLPDIALPPGLDGHVEAWTKWSFPLDPGRRVSMEWLPVDKVRWTRRYEVAYGAAKSISASELVPAACSAELALVRIESREAWSFGFEAFDTAGDARRALAIGAQAFVADSPVDSLIFELDDSYSYPAWLLWE